MKFAFIDLKPDHEQLIQQIAEMMVEGFKVMAPDAWPTIEAAREEVEESFDPERISRVAVDESGDAVGWIGGISEYDGDVWELHPLIVRPDLQKRGIGRALVADLEAQVRQRGGITIMLGSDDVADMTSLGGIDLYPNPLEHLLAIQNLKGHPYSFYQKVGFVLTGVVPDANGFGKPDIFMSKRVRPAD